MQRSNNRTKQNRAKSTKKDKKKVHYSRHFTKDREKKKTSRRRGKKDGILWKGCASVKTGKKKKDKEEQPEPNTSKIKRWCLKGNKNKSGST